MPPPFRADHIGSLIRPAALLQARAAHDDSHHQSSTHAAITGAPLPTLSATPSDLSSVQAAAIRNVVAEQIRRGITPITSGEFERWIFFAGFFEKLAGISTRFCDFRTDARPGLPQAKKAMQHGQTGRPTEIATGKVRWVESAYMADWKFLKGCVPEDRVREMKMTLPAPMTFHLQWRDGKAYAEGVYGSDAELLNDLAVATRSEIMALYGEGLRVTQIDDPNMSFFCDPEFVEALKKAGTDPEALLDSYVKVHNDVLAGLPDDLHIGVHLCRGNYPQAEFVASGGYERIAAKLLKELNYKHYYLEFDSDRAGDFQPLRVLPKEKSVILGVVTTKYAELEDLDILKVKVFQAADIIAQGQGRTREEILRDNLAVSPQCGFASVNFGKGKGFEEETQWRKLELVKRLAEEIWPQRD